MTEVPAVARKRRSTICQEWGGVRLTIAQLELLVAIHTHCFVYGDGASADALACFFDLNQASTRYAILNAHRKGFAAYGVKAKSRGLQLWRLTELGESIVKNAARGTRCP